MPSSFSPLVFSQSVSPSFRLFRSIHTTFSSFVVAVSLARPCGCAFEGNILKHIKRTSISACFSFSVDARVLLQSLYLRTWPLYLFKHRACYSGWTMCSYPCFFFLEAVFPLRSWSHSSLHNARVRMHKSQSAQYPVCIVMVPAYAQDAVAVCALLFCLLAVFSLFLGILLSRSCVYISFCCLPSCCPFQSQSLFSHCSFCSPGANACIRSTEAIREAVG